MKFVWLYDAEYGYSENTAIPVEAESIEAFQKEVLAKIAEAFLEEEDQVTIYGEKIYIYKYSNNKLPEVQILEEWWEKSIKKEQAIKKEEKQKLENLASELLYLGNKITITVSDRAKLIKLYCKLRKEDEMFKADYLEDTSTENIVQDLIRYILKNSLNEVDGIAFAGITSS